MAVPGYSFGWRDVPLHHGGVNPGWTSRVLWEVVMLWCGLPKKENFDQTAIMCRGIPTNVCPCFQKRQHVGAVRPLGRLFPQKQIETGGDRVRAVRRNECGECAEKQRWVILRHAGAASQSVDQGERQRCPPCRGGAVSCPHPCRSSFIGELPSDVRQAITNRRVAAKLVGKPHPVPLPTLNGERACGDLSGRHTVCAAGPRTLGNTDQLTQRT